MINSSCNKTNCNILLDWVINCEKIIKANVTSHIIALPVRSLQGSASALIFLHPLLTKLFLVRVTRIFHDLFSKNTETKIIRGPLKPAGFSLAISYSYHDKECSDSLLLL